MKQHTHTTRRPLRWIMLILATALVALLLSGCFGGQGAAPLSNAQFNQLGRDMVAIEKMSPEALATYEGTLEATIGRLTKGKNSKESALGLAEANFLLGYVAEARKAGGPSPLDSIYSDAQAAYEDATKGNTPYAAHARYRLGVLGSLDLLGTHDESMKIAKQELGMLKTAQQPVPIWVRDPALAGQGGDAALVKEGGVTASGPSLARQDAREIAPYMLDVIYRTGGGFDQTKYEIVDGIVNGFNRIAPKDGAILNGAVLALLLLAVLVKVLTIPFTNMTFRGMRDMQRIQPLLKELQEKYKDDKAKQAEEQMRIMKEHKVNPASGCLPMLIQLPIFLVVYQAVMVYAYPFAQYQFIWIKSLAQPDIPLLVLYAASMYVTQKLTATPATDPQQKMMQQQMTIMMPIFLLFVLVSFASAFVLYWLLLNILSSAHQYYLMRKFAREDEAAAQAAPAKVESAPARPRKRGKNR